MCYRVAFFFFFLLVVSHAELSHKIGINYGRLGNNLPSPYKSIEYLKSMKAGSVKIYDADAEVLKLLAGTKMYVSIMVPNDQINNIASNFTQAANWVQDNVIPYYPNTKIRYVLVGNEVLSFSSEQERLRWSRLVPAMRQISKALKARHIQNIKVGTPLAMDVLQITTPPSKATFRSDISSIMEPLLQFLNSTNSFFFIDVYPYFPWSSDPTSMSLDFALFSSRHNYTDPGDGLVYTNLLDQMLDSLVFAMTKLGYSNIRLAIAETGWPNGGDIDQPGANTYNAAMYNRNLIKRLTAKPPIGTPARPRQAIPTFIFSLYNENQKPGPGTERHWGLLSANGAPLYEIDLTGKQPESHFHSIPLPQNNMPYKGKLWCVAAQGANLNELEKALAYACTQGDQTCESLAPGKECYEPVSLTRHASYAFSSYFAQFRSQGASCYFDGLAEETTKDPSSGMCRFPSVTL